MTKRNLILQTAVAAALAVAFGPGAMAGTITSPATKYASEALTSATEVTLADVVYTMGVGRGVGQNFTIIVDPSSGATFDPATCGGANLVYTGAGAVAIATKRATAAECAWDVTVTTATSVGETFKLTGVKLATSPLATPGSSVSLSVSLKDPGETSYIDNVGAVTSKVATSVNAVNVYAAASDTNTVADVNDVNGPLLGFLANANAPADTASVAAAYLTLDNNSAGAKLADGATDFDFKTTTGTVTVNLTDASKAFAGLKSNKLCLDLNNNGTYCEAGEALTVNGNTGTITIPSADFPAAGGTQTDAASFQADGTTSLGTSRTIAVTGTVTPQVGAAHAIADTSSDNAKFWVWSANAIELWSPYVSTATGYLSRFGFQNIGSSAVTYTATCQAESGNTVTMGAAATGTLDPGMTVISASDVCTFSGNTRGSYRFVINAPAGNIHGTYTVVNPDVGSVSISNMERPFAQGTY